MSIDLNDVGHGFGVHGAVEAVRGRVNTVAEWRRPLTGAVLGLLLFETVTGLTVYFLPFSAFNQFSVLIHTILGGLMTAPVGWYLAQHWWRRFRGNFSHYQLLGYVSLAALIALFVSGLVLGWQAMFGQRISPAWDLVHVITGFVFIGAMSAHLLTLVLRRVNHDVTRRALRWAQFSCFLQSTAWGAVPVLACVALAATYRHAPLNDSFPPNYSFKYGKDRPYAPSLARKDMSAAEKKVTTRIERIIGREQSEVVLASFKPDPTKHVGFVTVAEKLCGELPLAEPQRAELHTAFEEARAAFVESGAIDPKRLAGSEGCGRCHEQIVKEWLPSAHRYASMDFVFQRVQENMAKELAPEVTRYCAGCHDPISLFSGAKNVGNETLSVEGADEGVSCLACHSIVQTDVRGNGDYALDPGERYVYEFDDGPVAQWVSDFLIRAYPRQHVDAYSRPLYKAAEACGACHKQFVDAEVNDFGWVQGQNQYDSWRKSRWHKEGDVANSISCRECHMPLVDSTDPAAGDRDDPNRHPNDGKHRSHRFLGANQFVPRFHKLPGAEKHCDLTVKWLRGEIQVPEIADRWTTGPVVRLSVVAPEVARPGEPVNIQTLVTNNKAGHDFPTGPMDMIEGWVEVAVTDADGKIVFTSSRADDRGYLINPQIVFKAELIDRLGELIGRHELWRLVGAKFKRVLFPGLTDTTTFTFNCPGMGKPTAAGAAVEPQETHTFVLPADAPARELKVTAVVWYTKFSAPFLDRLFGEAAKQRSEVTEVARAEAVIKVIHEEQASAQSTP